MSDTNYKKVSLGCRISPLAKSLVVLERKLYGGSEGEAVERLIYRASGGPEAADLILKEAAKDPQLSALIPAIRAAKAKSGL